MKNTMIFGTRVSKKLKDIKHTDQTPKPDGYNLNLTSNKKINDEFAQKMMDEQLRSIRIDNQRKLLENEAISFKNAAIDATRRTQYLSWQQQMEMVYKDQKNGTTTFKDHCDKVRSDNPKS